MPTAVAGTAYGCSRHHDARRLDLIRSRQRSFSDSVLIERRLQALCIVLAVAGLLAGLAIGCQRPFLKSALWDRTGERGPVEARLAVYDAGWAMFKERPLTGWAAGGMYAELAPPHGGLSPSHVLCAQHVPGFAG